MTRSFPGATGAQEMRLFELFLVTVLLEVLAVILPVVVEHFAELVHEVSLGFFFLAVVGFQVTLGAGYQEDVVAGGGEQEAGANQLRGAFIAVFVGVGQCNVGVDVFEEISGRRSVAVGLLVRS